MTAEKELETQIENLFALLEQVDCDRFINGFSFQVDWLVCLFFTRERNRESHINYF